MPTEKPDHGINTLVRSEGVFNEVHTGIYVLGAPGSLNTGITSFGYLMSAQDLSARSTHDLWIESRQFRLDISRPTPTSIELTVTRPVGLAVVDGGVLILNDKVISANNYPSDGTQYSGSTDFSAPQDIIGGAQGAHVLSFWSQILGQPFPEGTLSPDGTSTSFTVTVTNTDPKTIYYGSIHPVTNVLQYYPIGVQSYPLEASRVEKSVSVYTGSIPTLAEAPTDPVQGTVYHDQQLNLVQYWTGSSWIPTRADAILTGKQNPGVAGQAYILGGTVLKIFDGVKWVSGTPANVQFRAPSGFIPLGRVGAVTRLETAPILGDFCWNYTTQRAQYWDGSDWIIPNSTNSLFNTGSALIPTMINPMSIEPLEFPNPVLGQLFYNTSTKSLDVFNGVTWKQANTDQQGVTSTDKISVGNDGSYDERVRLINVLKAQLGWPQTCVELKEEQFNVAIDNALDNYRMWCAGGYRTAYIMYPILQDQQTYYLNSQVDKTDHIVDVVQIHRLNVLGIQAVAGNDAIWSSGILTSYYSAVTVDILSMHLISSLSEEFERLFAGNLTFLWDEPSRELFITRKVSRWEKVILECTMERTEQELLIDRWSKQFIQNWALAECKYQMGMIRSKYSSGTPGAAGTITLNGELLISEARQDMVELKQSAIDFEWGGMIGQGNTSFLIG